jgi:hypothetical protein
MTLLRVYANVQVVDLDQGAAPVVQAEASETLLLRPGSDHMAGEAIASVIERLAGDRAQTQAKTISSPH